MIPDGPWSSNRSVVLTTVNASSDDNATAWPSWWDPTAPAPHPERVTENHIFVAVVVSMVTLAIFLAVVTLGHLCTYDSGGNSLWRAARARVRSAIEAA